MDCVLLQTHEIEEALEARERYSYDGMPIAGGQSLLVMLRNKLIAPRALIDLEGLEELRAIRQGPNGLSIGAMTTFYSLLSSAVVKEQAPLLAQAADKVGSTPIRNLGTIGGNVCHNEPGADLPPALLTLEAVAELRSRRRVRRVPLAEFFRGCFETAVEPDEILCGIEIPKVPEGAGGVYLKHAITSEDLAMVGVAAVVIPDRERKGRIAEARLGLGGVAPIPFRPRKAEGLLRGAAVDEKIFEEAGEVAATETDPETDPHATADYRRKMVRLFVQRALRKALEQCDLDPRRA